MIAQLATSRLLIGILSRRKRSPLGAGHQLFKRQRLGHLDDEIVELCDNVLSGRFSVAIKLQLQAQPKVQRARGFSEFRKLLREVLNLIRSQLRATSTSGLSSNRFFSLGGGSAMIRIAGSDRRRLAYTPVALALAILGMASSARAQNKILYTTETSPAPPGVTAGANSYDPGQTRASQVCATSDVTKGFLFGNTIEWGLVLARARMLRRRTSRISLLLRIACGIRAARSCGEMRLIYNHQSGCTVQQ